MIQNKKLRLIACALVVLAAWNFESLLCMWQNPSDQGKVEAAEEDSATQPLDEEDLAPIPIVLSPHGHRHATHTHIGGRSNMEDCYTNLPATGFYGVYDGHGEQKRYRCETVYSGHLPAQDAKTHLHTYITEQSADGICKGFLEFNERHTDHKARGTTATVITFAPDGTSFFVANVGDSHAVCCIDGKAVRLTQNHHPSEPFEQERIHKCQDGIEAIYDTQCNSKLPMIIEWTAQGPTISTHYLEKVTRVGRYGSAGLTVSRALGDLESAPFVTAEPFVQEIVCDTSQHFIILATDGLWDAITEQAAVDFVQVKMAALDVNHLTISAEQATHIAQDLVTTAMGCFQSDNVTATIIFLNHPPH